MIRTFEDLEVYRRAIESVSRVYQLLRGFPEYEKYELASQLRRASCSVPCNIAEGYGRKKSLKEFKKFLTIAQGSANEVIVLIDIAKRLGYVCGESVDALQEEYRIIVRQLYKLIENWK